LSSFEYVMVLVSIVIGLAITHVLTAFAAAVQRLRGHGEPIRLEAVYLLWTGYVMTMLVSFWWWEFKYHELEIEWSYGLYLFIITYAVTLFLMAAVLVPKGMEGVSDSYAFFMEGRNWFFVIHLFVISIDIIDTFLKGADFGLRPSVLVSYAPMIGASIVGIVSERRWVQVVAAATAFASQLIYMFQTLGVLGSW